jgi:hypothetical protein
MIADEDVHRHAVENLSQADALLFGRVTYEIMEAAWASLETDGGDARLDGALRRTIDAANWSSARGRRRCGMSREGSHQAC